VPVFRIGLLGGENESDRLREHACQEAYLEERLGVDVELFPASDYAGVMQGLLAGQLEFAGLGSAGYAGIYLQDPDAVEPLYTTMQIDGSLGYYSVMYTLADSGITSLDMEGHSLAFADPNSTSGYLVPSFELASEEGLDLETYFSETGFGGGHEQAVVAVLNGQYDAGVTWTSGVGDINMGYPWQPALDGGQGHARHVGNPDHLAVEPHHQRPPRDPRRPAPGTQGPGHGRDDAASGRRPRLLHAINDGESMGYWPINHEFYEPIINMRRELAGSR
jgi:phosphonate transport system substrate-binding protein